MCTKNNRNLFNTLDSRECGQHSSQVTTTGFPGPTLPTIPHGLAHRFTHGPIQQHHGDKHAARYEKSLQCSTDTHSSDNASSFHAVKSIPFDSVHDMPMDYDLCSQLTELRKLRSTGEFNTSPLEHLRYKCCLPCSYYYYGKGT